MANSKYIEEYPTVELSFENVLKLLNLTKQEERKLREYQEDTGNPYIEIIPKDTPGFSGDLNRPWADWRDDSLGVYEHKLEEHLKAEYPHLYQGQHAREKSKKSGFLEGLYNKLRKYMFPTVHDEINDLLDKYQPETTLKQLYTRLGKEKSDIGERVYHDKPYNITSIYDKLLDTLNTVAGYPVERSGVFSGNLKEFEEFFSKFDYSRSKGKKALPTIESFAHGIIEQLLKKDFADSNKEYKYTGKREKRK